MATDDRNTAEESGPDRRIGLDRGDESQSFVDQEAIDFDPDDGVYSGTAVDGTSEIPGPHMDGDSGELSQEDVQRQAQKQAGE